MKNKAQIIAILLICLLLHTFGYGQLREITNLNKEWKFVLIDKDADYMMLQDSSWVNINIPHTWNNKDIQSGEKVQYCSGLYKKTVKIKKSKTEKAYFLRFKGVGQYAELYINSKYVGKHLGSYSAFTFNVTDFIKTDANNEILVKVNNELTDAYPRDNFLFAIYGGLYRGVDLIATNELHLGLTDYASKGVYVKQEKISSENAELQIVTLLNNESSERKDVIIKNKLRNKSNEIVAENSTKKTLHPCGLKQLSINLSVNNPILWNGRKNPYLYTLESEIIHNGSTVDKVVQNIGIRYFEVDTEKGFMLNGKPYRLYGVCRHQEWKDIGNALLTNHHKTDMELIHEMGATSVRLSHYQQADYIYDLADSLGLLIWTEIPFVNGYQENADDNAKQQLIELIKQQINHPSIFAWGIHNEVVNGDIVQEPAQLTRELHNISKTMDASRYTVCASDLWWKFDHGSHELTDLQGYNQYSGWYGGPPSELEEWINNYHKAKPDIRFSISEYGAGANVQHQDSDISTRPNPKGKFFPEGYQTYYHEATSTIIEKYPYIWSSYIWCMFDFAIPGWNRGGVKGRNHKGLVSYDRKIKKDAFYWYKANWSEEPVLYLTGRRNNILTSNNITFIAYCNFATPTLYINGKDYGIMKQGINTVQFLSTEIHLEKGQYKIEIKSKNNGILLSDEFQLEVK